VSSPLVVPAHMRVLGESSELLEWA